jgi:hypothetical protein
MVTENREYTEDELEALTEDEIDQIDVSQEPAEEPEKPETPQEEAETPSEKDVAEVEKPDAQEDPKGEKPKIEEPAEDRYKNLQSEFTRKSQRLKELEAKNAEMEAALKKQQEELAQAREAQLQTFEELSQEELDVLETTDPKAYLAYMKKHEAHEQLKNRVEQEREELVQETQRINFENFMQELYPNAKFNFDAGLDEQSDPNAQKAVAEGKFWKVIDYVKQNMNPGEYGFTKDQYQAAYKVVYHDQIVAEARNNAAVNTVDALDDVPGQRLVDRPGGQKRKPVDFNKPLDDEDVDNMTEEELKNATGQTYDKY